MRVKSQIHSNITLLEKTNFTNVIESTNENVTVKAKMNGLQSCIGNPQNDEADSAENNSEAVEITYIDDSKSPTNMKTESQLDSNFIYSKGCGENGASALEPVKEVINASLYGTLMHSSKAIVEMDVERVLEEQDTHDLYCPNCNSCITKRVILRKRKRIVQDVQLDTKRERIEPLLPPGLGDSPAATDEPRHDRVPDVFKCLSCFSIFIPSDGFKSFWIFRRNNEGKNFQSPQQTPARNLSWIPPIFGRFRVKNTRNKPVGETVECVQEDSAQTSVQFQNPTETQTVSETPLVTNDPISVGKVPPVGSNSMITSIPRILPPNGVPIKGPENAATPTGPEADGIEPVEEGIVTPGGTVSSQNNPSVSSSPAPVVSTDQETIIEIPQQKVDKTMRHEWDILKSIVYGGLVESVTSLGVVSSAAGSDANTLNIVALGLANLFGGLFVLAHNLRELKKEQVIGADQREEKLDPYRETLGRRENFKRHAVAAVLSYIIFGLIPPVVYGFSFLRSDNKEYKLISVAVASLVCIAFLAIGKAHVGRAPKTYVKTLLYYIFTGVTASGLSYVAGQLLNQLLEKLGLFNSSTHAAPTSVFLESNATRSGGWTSY